MDINHSTQILFPKGDSMEYWNSAELLLKDIPTNDQFTLSDCDCVSAVINTQYF